MIDKSVVFDEPKLGRVDYHMANGAADRVIRWLIFGGVLAILGTIGIVAAIVFTDDADPWQPIGDYPQQTVVEVTSTHVVVVGTKCFHESITTRGELSWQSVEPVGVVAAIGVGTAVRDLDDPDFDDDGCTTRTFENPIPATVAEAVDVTAWKISGVDEPIADSNGDERHGLAQVWETEPFSLTVTCETDCP